MHDENSPLTCTLCNYEPNATWTDKNGAKTKDLWVKQDWKDLDKINCRSQGLAEKIPETHQIVLANRLNFGVRSGKGHRWDLIAET